MGVQLAHSTFSLPPPGRYAANDSCAGNPAGTTAASSAKASSGWTLLAALASLFMLPAAAPLRITRVLRPVGCSVGSKSIGSGCSRLSVCSHFQNLSSSEKDVFCAHDVGVSPPVYPADGASVSSTKVQFSRRTPSLDASLNWIPPRGHSSEPIMPLRRRATAFAGTSLMHLYDVPKTPLTHSTIAPLFTAVVPGCSGVTLIADAKPLSQ
mmetsp:Transcript_236/g.928  ORF Transcript_236/g.928 Transcript_236/m.928 type:complete len:210 (-) Transcript_236:13-642(-)